MLFIMRESVLIHRQNLDGEMIYCIGEFFVLLLIFSFHSFHTIYLIIESLVHPVIHITMPHEIFYDILKSFLLQSIALVQDVKVFCFEILILLVLAIVYQSKCMCIQHYV